MATYEDVLQEMGPAPRAPADLRFLGWRLNPQAQEDYRRQRALYETEASERLKQRLLPTRDMTLGQVSNISGLPGESLANPTQFRDVEVREPSQVPSYRYVPTLSQDPSGPPLSLGSQAGGLVPRSTQLQGPPDLRQQEGGPLEEHYPFKTDLVPQPPSLRPAQGPAGYRPLEPQLRPSFNQFVGSFEPSQGPDVVSQQHQLNPDAPADRYQQHLAMSGIERESRWPRSMGSGGANTISTKINALMNAGIPYDEAARTVIGGEPLAGGLKAENLAVRSGTSAARGADLESSAKYRGLNFEQRERQNAWMNDFRNRQLALRDQWHRDSQRAMDQKDELGWARLNEQRYWHDLLADMARAIDKAGILTKEQKLAFREAESIIGQLSERPATPDELGFLESIFGPRPRYTHTPRPPVGPTGGAPPMSRPRPSAGGSQPSRSAVDDSAELAEAAKAATNQAPGSRYQAQSGKIYTWTGTKFE